MSRTLVSDNHRNDQAVDAKHTRHHNGDDRLHDQVRLHDSHGGHANARLGGAIGGTQVCAEGAARDDRLVATGISHADTAARG